MSPEFGTNTGRQGIFDPLDPEQLKRARNRYAELSQQYQGGQLEPNFTGSTGLAKNDSRGWSTMLNAATEFQNIRRILGGQPALKVQYGGTTSTRVTPPVGSDDMPIRRSSLGALGHQGRSFGGDPDSFEEQNWRGYGSGAEHAASQAVAEARQLAAENASSRFRLEGQDLDGSQAAAVARGAARADQMWASQHFDPQMQINKNALLALAGQGARDEWSADFDTQAPQRQHQIRLAGEAPRIYSDARIQSAELGADAKVKDAYAQADARIKASQNAANASTAVASTNAQGRVDQEIIEQGGPDAAALAREMRSLVENAINELRTQSPNATPSDIFQALGPNLTPEEIEHAQRILGGGGGPLSPMVAPTGPPSRAYRRPGVYQQ